MAQQSERGGYIPGVPCWLDVTVPDPAAVLPFYQGVFGWDVEDVLPDGDFRYYIARIRGGDVAAISSIAEGAPSVPTWNTYIWVTSADESAVAVGEAGGTVLTEPFDVGEYGRMAVVADTEGAVFALWQDNTHGGAEVVNEHGAINFNGLATRDLAGAEAFYGAVFGWQKLPLPGGAAWALPAYGDNLEKASPGRREQMQHVGAPDGFADVVAAVNPIPDDDADTPVHWNVTFGIDDVDEAALKSTDLGGKVVEAPHDIPWARSAVLADPQGATFVISQFKPENKDLAG